MNLSEPGVGDFVLLNEVSENAFMDNLEKRFAKDRIYVRRQYLWCNRWAVAVPAYSPRRLTRFVSADAAARRSSATSSCR